MVEEKAVKVRVKGIHGEVKGVKEGNVEVRGGKGRRCRNGGRKAEIDSGLME